MYTRVMRALLDYLGYGLPRPGLAWDCEWEAQAIIEHGRCEACLAEAYSAVSPPHHGTILGSPRHDGKLSHH